MIDTVRNSAGPLETATHAHGHTHSQAHSLPHPHHHPHETILSHDFSSIAQGSEASLTPPSVPSSITSSPPRQAFNPDQREAKRHQDRSRRDYRQISRLRRVSSQPPFMEQAQGPTQPHHMPIHEVTSSVDMPTAYSTAAPAMSLLTEPAAPMQPHQSYMPTYSPSIQDPNQAQMFPTPYSQSMCVAFSRSLSKLCANTAFSRPPNYSMPMEYPPNSYTSPNSYG